MDGINIIDIPINIFNFFVTFVLLYLLLYKPVSKFLGDRKDRIASNINAAEEMRKEAEAALHEAKEELANTGEKARQLSHETIENAALDAERILDNAKEEAHVLRMRARAQMEAERQAALERAFTELVSLAGGLASRILSREVSIDDNREIVDNFFSEETGKFDSDKIFASGNEAAVKRSNNHERV